MCEANSGLEIEDFHAVISGLGVETPENHSQFFLTTSSSWEEACPVPQGWPTA